MAQLASRKRDASTQHELALKHYAAGNHDAALRHFERAAGLNPQSSAILFNLATLLYDNRNYTAAERIYQQCVAVDPANFKARNNFGAILRARGEYSAAIEQFAAAQTSAPDSLEIALNLAATLHDAERYSEAESVYRKIRQSHPDQEAAKNGLACCLERQGKLESAGALLQQQAETNPHDLLANLRSELLAPSVFSSTAAIDQYRQTLSRSLMRFEQKPFTLRQEEIPASACKPPLALAYGGGDVLRYKRALARAVARHVQAEPPLAPTGKPHVGFLATHRHEAVFLRGMAELIRALPTDRFDVTVITSEAATKRARVALRNDAIATASLPTDFPAMIAMLRSLRLDLLYYWEIGTDPTNYFLPFYRTAPLQCTSWGWPVTSGMTEVDYFLSSDLLETPAADAHYSEQLIRFPKLPNVYRRPQVEPPAWSREDFGFGPREHIYFCPQNPLKITPDLDKLFIRILQEDSVGRLLLLCGREPHVAEAIHRRIAEQATDVADRVNFVPRTSGQQYRALIQASDILLDTIHYCGGANTNCDALSIDKPMVTLPTEFHRGRYTQAVYQQLGVMDSVAADGDEYVELALRLAREQDFRHDLSQRLHDRSELIYEDSTAIARMAAFIECAIAESRAKS